MKIENEMLSLGVPGWLVHCHDPIAGWPVMEKGVATGEASWADALRLRAAKARPRAPLPMPARAVRRVTNDGDRLESSFIVNGSSWRHADPSANSDVLPSEGWGWRVLLLYKIIPPRQATIARLRGDSTAAVKCGA